MHTRVRINEKMRSTCRPLLANLYLLTFITVLVSVGCRLFVTIIIVVVVVVVVVVGTCVYKIVGEEGRLL